MLRLHCKYMLASVCLVQHSLDTDHWNIDTSKPWKRANIILCGHTWPQHPTKLMFLQGINCILVAALCSCLFNIQTKTEHQWERAMSTPCRRNFCLSVFHENIKHYAQNSHCLCDCFVWHIIKSLRTIHLQLKLEEIYVEWPWMCNLVTTRSSLETWFANVLWSCLIPRWNFQIENIHLFHALFWVVNTCLK